MPHRSDQVKLVEVEATEGPNAVFKALQDAGGVVTKNFLTKQQVYAINTEIDLVLAKLSAGSTSAEEYIKEFHGLHTKRLTNLATLSETFRSDLSNQDLLYNVSYLVFREDAGDFWLSTAQVIEIGPGDKAQELHRDQMQFPVFTRLGPEGSEATINWFVALIDFTEENANLMMGEPDSGRVATYDSHSQDQRTHYFQYCADEVLPLLVMFETPGNPFRSTPMRLRTSPTMLQSSIVAIAARHQIPNGKATPPQAKDDLDMAIADLASGVQKLLSVHEPGPPEARADPFIDSCPPKGLCEALFATILVGLSSTWVDPADTGIKYLHNARKLFGRWQADSEDISPSDVETGITYDECFFAGILAYWEALLAFVFDQPLDALEYLEKPAECAAQSRKVNPWTGYSALTLLNLAKVGVVVRQRRGITQLDHLHLDPAIQQSIATSLLERAAVMEVELLRPSLSKDLDHSSDLRTDMSRFTTSYKLAALLELYHHFPELLTTDATSPAASSTDYANQTAADESRHSCRVSSSKTCLDIALTILSLLKETSDGNAISIAQTLPLIVAGSAMQQHRVDSTSATSGAVSLLGELAAIQSRFSVVEDWRSFVRVRLEANAQRCVLGSIGAASRLMDEVWKRHDAAGPGSHEQVQWIGVMSELKLETIYG